MNTLRTGARGQPSNASYKPYAKASSAHIFDDATATGADDGTHAVMQI
jgi:hypothetical protein